MSLFSFFSKRAPKITHEDYVKSQLESGHPISDETFSHIFSSIHLELSFTDTEDLPETGTRMAQHAILALAQTTGTHAEINLLRAKNITRELMLTNGSTPHGFDASLWCVKTLLDRNKLDGASAILDTITDANNKFKNKDQMADAYQLLEQKRAERQNDSTAGVFAPAIAQP